MACNVIYVSWLLFIQIPMIYTVAMAKIPALIVFGDSTVDSGNNNFIPTIAKADFPPYGRDFPGSRPTGRFSNGRLATDFISEYLGLNPSVPAFLDPKYNISSFATAVCFASAGTGFDTSTSSVLKVIPLWKQLDFYKEYQKKLRASLGNEKADEVLREALYIVSIGTNDFLINYYLFPDKQAHFTDEEYADFLTGIGENFFKELHNLGARKIFVVGLTSFGCVPLARTANIFSKQHECKKRYNDAALDVNSKLNRTVANLNSRLPGLKMVLANTYNILDQILARPSSLGFEVTDRGCCGTGTFELGFLCSKDNPLTCKDAAKYVFWDSVHPSERTYQIVADILIKEIQEMFP